MLIGLPLSGCSSADQGPPNETVDPVAAEVEAWADEVCGATGELRAAVSGLAEAVDFDLAAGLGQIPAIYEQLQSRIQRVEVGIADFQGVVAEAPEDSPEAVSFAAEVQTLSTSARAAGEEALQLAQQAIDARNFLSSGTALAGAASAAQRAYADANAALTLVEQAPDSGAGPIAMAFSEAPQCRRS